MGELYQYTVTSDSPSLAEQKTLHDYVIRPRLRTLAGVSEANSWRGHVEPTPVEAGPVRLAARAPTLADVHRALAANNLPFGGSYVERGGERYTVRGVGRVGSAADLGDVVLDAHGGTPIRIADVATVA